jgi:fibronectin type 3 domain-containing protein
LCGIVLITLASLALNGCGGGGASPTVQVTAHSVTLTWAAAASPVSGYAVYRSTADPTGPFYPLAITLPGTTQYTDTNVVAGETYFYTLTAFDSANLQSLPTNAVSVTIPSP